MQPTEDFGHATPISLGLRRFALRVRHHCYAVREQPPIRRRNRHRHGQSLTVEVFEKLSLPFEISVAPGTKTTNREASVETHAPHVVGDSTGEWLNASCVFTLVCQGLPSHC